MKSMKKLGVLGTIAGAALVLTGCEDIVICDSLCSTYVDCVEDVNASYDCTWEVSTADVERDCRDACLDAVEEVGSKDKEALLDCTTCVEDELQGLAECTISAYGEALSACSSECSDSDFDKFWTSWGDAWDPYTKYTSREPDGTECTFQ
jgi:hypothetical protein